MDRALHEDEVNGGHIEFLVARRDIGKLEAPPVRR